MTVRIGTICCVLALVVGCAAVSQQIRGQSDLPESERQQLAAQYIGKTVWLKMPVYKGKAAEEFAHAVVPQAAPRTKAYDVELAAWEPVVVKELLFGEGLMNSMTVIDAQGKVHPGAIQIRVPTYTAMARSQPDHTARVRRDYEYAIARALSTVDRQAYVRMLTDRYGAETAAAIDDQLVILGMPAEAVIESWGRPGDINRTITAGVTSEQWVYGALPNQRLVYLENGVVTGLQD